MFPAYPNPAVEWTGEECVHVLLSMLRLCDLSRAELRRAPHLHTEAETRLDMISGNARRCTRRVVVTAPGRMADMLSMMLGRLGHGLRLRIARDAYGKRGVIGGIRDGHVTPFRLGRWSMSSTEGHYPPLYFSLLADKDGGGVVADVGFGLVSSCHRVDVDGDNLVMHRRMPGGQTDVFVLDLSEGGRLRLRRLQNDDVEVYPECYMPWLEEESPMQVWAVDKPLPRAPAPTPSWRATTRVDLALVKSRWKSPDQERDYGKDDNHYRRVEMWEEYLCGFVCRDYDTLVDGQSNADEGACRRHRKRDRRYWI